MVIKSKLHSIIHRPVGKTDLLVTAYCMRCFDISTIEGEFHGRVFKRIIPTRHITQHGKGKNMTFGCWCGGEVKIFLPKYIK